MDVKYLNFGEQDGIVCGQFNRPAKLNALNPAELRDLETVVAGCEEDDAIEVVVSMGNKKAFVAGADIEHVARSDIQSTSWLTD